MSVTLESFDGYSSGFVCSIYTCNLDPAFEGYFKGIHSMN